MIDVRTVGSLFAATVDRDPTRPLLTFYDDATGERTELSGATLANWVAKTANMLVDDCGLDEGGWAAVGLPPHWQTAAVLLGCWTAGLAVTTRPEPADVAFVHGDLIADEWPADGRYALGLHPMALPLKSVPPGFLDFTGEVRAHGDHFRPRRPVAPENDALRGSDRVYSHAELCEFAERRGVEWGMVAGGRVLVDVDTYPDPVDWLVAPIVTGCSIVACRHLDATLLDARAGAELVTRRVV